MNWASLQDFLEMGGDALYVWSAYAMAAGAIGWEALLLWQRRRRALDEARQQALLEGAAPDEGR